MSSDVNVCICSVQSSNRYPAQNKKSQLVAQSWNAQSHSIMGSESQMAVTGAKLLKNNKHMPLSMNTVPEISNLSIPTFLCSLNIS